MTLAIPGRLALWQSSMVASGQAPATPSAPTPSWPASPPARAMPIGRLAVWQHDLWAASPLPSLPALPPPAPMPIPQAAVAPALPSPSLPAVPSPAAPPPAPQAAPPPLPAPVSPTPTPKPSPAPPLATALSGLQAGRSFQLAEGTQVKGHSVDGKAQVQSFDGKALTLNLMLSAAFGLVRKQVALSLQDEGQGKLRVVATEVRGHGEGQAQLYAETMAVVAASKGELQFRTPQGEKGSLRLRPDGGIELDSPLGRILMQPS